MSLGCWRKPGCAEETHTGTARTCKHHKVPSQLADLNAESVCCKVAVLTTTMLQCCKQNVIMDGWITSNVMRSHSVKWHIKGKEPDSVMLWGHFAFV